MRNRAPMVWTYFQQPPQDGATLLTWQPPQRHSQFASDGYVWADPEQSYQTDVGGYVWSTRRSVGLEMLSNYSSSKCSYAKLGVAMVSSPWRLIEEAVSALSVRSIPMSTQIRSIATIQIYGLSTMDRPSLSFGSPPREYSAIWKLHE